MALPPRGDPRRPLHQSIRSTAMMGVVFVLLGSFAATRITLARMGRGRGIPAPPAGALVSWLFYLVPGTLFLVFAVFMRRRRRWAVVGALVVTSVCAVFLVAVGVTMFVLMVAEGEDKPGPVLLVFGVWTASLLWIGVMIHRVALSLKAVKLLPFGRADDARGFEPLAPRPEGPAIIGPGRFPASPPQPRADPADGRDTTHDPAAPR